MQTAFVLTARDFCWKCKARSPRSLYKLRSYEHYSTSVSRRRYMHDLQTAVLCCVFLRVHISRRKPCRVRVKCFYSANGLFNIKKNILYCRRAFGYFKTIFYSADGKSQKRPKYFKFIFYNSTPPLRVKCFSVRSLLV